MAQITDLNVSPYYDDYDEKDNFHKVLFRPGYSIQARELTTLQSILQNQVERHGSHIFKEGTVVIPGQVSYSTAFNTLQLSTTFANEDIVAAAFYNETNPVIITGSLSGVKAKVIGFTEATTTDQPILHLQYISIGTDNVTPFFSNSENITANTTITHTTTYAANIASATTHDNFASQIGTAVSVEEGVYYIRGHFVRCAKETLVLSINNTLQNGRIGFNITETLVTPETDATLTDNATGSNNYAAKGAHRLKIALNLVKLDTDSTADSSFVELMKLDTGNQVSAARNTDYSVLGETMARRTFDESGDYTVRNFLYEMKESVTQIYRGKTNIGAYTAGNATDGALPASSDLLALSIKPGKAYVKGFEIDKIATSLVDVKKARDFQTVNAGVTTFDIGNFVFIKNVYGTPDITQISGETTPYKEIEIFTDFTDSTNRGLESGYQIGVCRARTIEYFSGIQGNTDAIYKMFLFDVRMFTFLSLSGVPSPSLIATHTNGGVQIKGLTSGATGLLYSSNYSNVNGSNGQTRFAVTNVVGNFEKGEKIIASDSSETGKIVENSGNTDLTIADISGSHDAIVTHEFREARSFFMSPSNSFSADAVLAVVDENGNMLLDGTDAGAADAFGKVIEDDGSTRVTLETQQVAKIINPEKNVALFKLPKAVIKTLLTATNSGATDTQYTIRRQFVGTTDSSGAVTFSAGSNETFISFASRDYTLSITTAGGGTGIQGDIVLLSDSKISGEGTASITVTDSTILGSGAKVKLTATILKTSVIQKAKTTKLSKQLKVIADDADGAYGTRSTDVDISFGRGDVYRLQAVFDSEDTSVDAAAPTLTLTTPTGNFVRGERITGSVTGALGRTVTTTTPLQYTLIGGISADDFSIGETITGAHSGATAVVSAITAGSKNITNLFTLDSGQRDNFYDIARIVRKVGAPTPLGRLLVIYDYLEHGAGDVFTVDSYTSLNSQMLYKDIPVYSSTRVDPDDPEPTGVFDLRDSYDFRPRAEDIAGTSSTLADVDQVTGNSFNFENRQFDGGGATTVDMPQPGSLIQSDFEFYLPKRGTLFLTSAGQFKVVEGVSSEAPQLPKDIDNALKLASLFIPAFTFSPNEVIIERFKTQRFTMKDIGRLQERIENIEYYTALSLLEKDTASFEVRNNQTGFNRFKSGFVVDNFSGHRVGDALNKDYKIAVDQDKQELRPKSISKNVQLQLPDNLVSAQGVKTLIGENLAKTGDLVTIDYDEVILFNQPFATRVENIQPFLVAGFAGKITITPTGDEWFETEVAPALVINRDGDFDTFAAENANAIGTVWNAWETQWSGTSTVNLGTSVEGINNNATQATIVTRAIDVTNTTLRRVGTQTTVGSRLNEESQGSKVVSRGVVPFIRPRVISFKGECFAPNARLYVFFDRVAVSTFVTPLAAFTSDATPVAGSPLICNASGKVEGTFQIPDYRPQLTARGGTQNVTVPIFRTGDVEFRVTTSETNARSGPNSASKAPFSAATAVYSAKGILDTVQETIIATREPTLVQNNVDQETIRTNIGQVREITRRVDDIQAAVQITNIDNTVTNNITNNITNTTNVTNVNNRIVQVIRPQPPQGDDGGNDDPLAQTFLLAEDGGTFITSFDFFFSAKDNNLPVWCEVRDVVNGYPGMKILPFGRKTLDSSEVNLNNTTGTTPTRFTFDSPVFLQSGTEYCVVLRTASLDYRVWIAQMGETDVSGSDRVVSKQPTLGVLFKSQNNRTWNAVQMEDLKFIAYRAKFKSQSGNLALSNKQTNLESPKLAENGTTTVYGKKLIPNPLIMEHNSTVLQVKHEHHGMYATANNVTITGVKGQISTTLNGAITATSTSLTLTSASGFAASNLSSRCYVKINNEIIYGTLSGTTISSLVRGDSIDTSGAAAAHADDSIVQLYQIHGVPLDQVNKIHTAIANIDTNAYTVSLTTAPTITGADGTPKSQIGLNNVYATENYRFENIKPLISALELPTTSINALLKTTSATSPSGSEASFTTETTAKTIQLNENFTFDSTRMIASDINQTNELAGAASFFLDLTFNTLSDNLSPVLDIDRMSIITTANIIDNIDSNSDIYPTTDYVDSIEPQGDNNSAIYITKKVALQNPATALKVLFDGNRPATSDIKVMHKILPAASSDDFDDLGYVYFNDVGSPDNPVSVSLTNNDFQEYEFTAGVKDDGFTNDPLPEFIQFSIKIILQGTNAAQVPKLKSLRVIALDD